MYIQNHTNSDDTEVWGSAEPQVGSVGAKGLPALNRAADRSGLGRLGHRPSRSPETPAAPPGELQVAGFRCEKGEV